MSDAWTIRGREFVNCNCAYGCPCQFSSPSTHGFCEAAVGIVIDEGRFNEIKLGGFNVVYLIKWPGEIASGNGTRQLIIDERADARQRQAIETIVGGGATQPGTTHFYVFASTVSKRLETLFKPIEMSIDIEARRANIKVDGLVEILGEPLIDPFSKQETRKGIHLPGGFEFTYAEVASGRSKVTAGITLDLKDSHGHFCELHMNQDGVIREKRAEVSA